MVCWEYNLKFDFFDFQHLCLRVNTQYSYTPYTRRRVQGNSLQCCWTDTFAFKRSAARPRQCHLQQAPLSLTSADQSHASQCALIRPGLRSQFEKIKSIVSYKQSALYLNTFKKNLNLRELCQLCLWTRPFWSGTFICIGD